MRREEKEGKVQWWPDIKQEPRENFLFGRTFKRNPGKFYENASCQVVGIWNIAGTNTRGNRFAMRAAFFRSCVKFLGAH